MSSDLDPSPLAEETRATDAHQYSRNGTRQYQGVKVFIRRFFSNRRLVIPTVAVLALTGGVIAGYALSASDRSQLATLEEEYSNQTESVRALQEEVRALETHVSGLEDEIGRKDAEISQIDRRETDLDDRESSLDDFEQDLDERSEELDSREQAITETEDEIESNTISGDGIWVVGEEVRPGRYKAQGSGTSCYWARLNSLDTFDIINNHFGSANVTVEIHSGDAAFETSGCGSWKKQ